MTAISADAALIRLCEIYMEQWTTIEEADWPIPDEMIEAMNRDGDIILAMPVHTLEGAFALAHVAKLVGTLPDGTENPTSTMGGEFAWAAVGVLSRLNSARP